MLIICTLLEMINTVKYKVTVLRTIPMSEIYSDLLRKNKFAKNLAQMVLKTKQHTKNNFKQLYI